MEPLVSVFASVVIIPDLSLQLRDPIFGRSKLMGKLLSHIERMLTVFIGYAGGLVEQAQNGPPSDIKLIGII